MSDAIDAVEIAAYAALAAAITGADVYQHAPDNAEPPVVIVGDIEASPIGSKDDPDRRVSLTVVSITEGQERKPCSQLVAQVEATLDGAELEAGGFKILLMLETSSVVLAGDAETYVGTSIFTGFALTA